jgi:hypothetical protein
MARPNFRLAGSGVGQRRFVIIDFKHYSIRTEETYRNWIRRYILFHGKRHPREMGPGPLRPKAEG